MSRDFTLPPAAELMEQAGDGNQFASGFNSNVYRVDDYALKVLKFQGSVEAVEGLAAVLRGEHHLVDDYLSPWVPPTRIDTVEALEADRVVHRIGVVQPFVAGLSVREALQDPDLDKTGMTSFLAAAREMYRCERKMPDIAHVETGFRFSRTPNVVVDPDDGRPTLVDTTFGKIHRKPRIGRVWHAAMAAGATIALRQLEFRRALESRA